MRERQARRRYPRQRFEQRGDSARQPQRQALARIGESGGRPGFDLLGEAFAFRAEAVGSPAPSIGYHRLECVVGLQPLPDEIPEGNQRGPNPFIQAWRADNPCQAGQLIE